MVKEGARLELLEMRIHENWHFTKLMMCFCRWKKDANFEESLENDITLSVEESTIRSEVDTNDYFNEDNVDLYAFEMVQKLQEEDTTSIVSSRDDAKIGRAIFPISLENDLTIKERSDIHNLFHNYHHLFTTIYKDVKKAILEEHKIELLLNAKPLWQRFQKMNPNYAQTIKEGLNKLLETQLIVLVENLKWVSPITMKKKRKFCVCVNY